MKKPNCYKCKWRDSVPGSAHSCCKHPSLKKNSMGELLSIFTSVGRMSPSLDFEGARILGIKGNTHGFECGWFNWPWNFDPVWLDVCNGWKNKTTD